MATRIRLRRMGRAKRPVFSIVVVDSRKARDSSFIEDLGRYYPLEEPAEVKLKQERAMHWLRSGAQPSDTVRGIFSDQGLMLRLHLERKGTSEEDIERIVAEWEEDRGEEKFDVTTEAELKEEAEAAEVEGAAEAEVEAETEEVAEEADEEAETEPSAEQEEAEEAEEAEAEEADVEAVHKAQAEASKEEAAAASEREVEEAKEQEETQEEREA